MRSGDVITRHNKLRNLIETVAAEALLQPVLEKEGILGSSSGRRPGDATLPLWEGGKGLAIDVAVTSPFTQSAVKKTGPL